MIYLDATLQAAQDGDNHQPIIDIVSASFSEAIPFEGNLFNSLTTDETSPDLIEHSTGRMVCVACRGNDLVLLLTDTDKTEWAEYTVYTGSQTMKPCLCELSSGDIGIIFSDTSYRLYRLVVDVAGTVVTAAGLINDYATWISGPSVERLAGESYLLAYAYYNGSTYSISTRTSSDFLTWGSAATISPSGLDNTMRMDNPDIAGLSSGDWFLVFDYVDDAQDSQEFVNCYAMTSDDSGATWSAPEKLTDYTALGVVGADPSIAERDDGTVEIAYTEENDVLYMDEYTTGWSSAYDSVQDIHYIPSTNKLIFNQVFTGLGTKNLRFIGVVDVATWSIETVYTSTSNPAYDSYWSSNHVRRGRQTKSSGKYATCHAEDYLLVIDTVLDTVTQYNFSDSTEYGFTLNMESVPWDVTEYGWDISFVQIDADNDRAYICWSNSYTRTRYVHVGYIDLTEEPDPVSGNYTWNDMFELSFPDVLGVDYFRVQPSDDMIIITFPAYTSLGGVIYNSAMYVYSISSAAILYSYDSDVDTGFHKYGAKWPIYYNGHIYAGTSYLETYDQGDRYGLMDINLSTGAIRYHRPSWGTYDDYNLNEKTVTDDGRILISCSSYGITTFYPATESWVLYNNDSVPGITTLGTGYQDIDYDPENNIIFTSVADSGEGGILAFSEDGSFQQLKYITGTESSDVWEYTDSADLTATVVDSMPAIAVDSDDVLWAAWSSKSGSEQSLTWDRDEAEKNLTDYLTHDPVTASWEVDSAAALSFALSHGHLFDPSNPLSTIAPFVKKGKKIELQMGETVSGTDYLQDHGSFIITETKINYERGKYPSISIACEDMRTIWEDGVVAATEYFSDESPDDILSALAQDHGNLDLTEISFPTIDGSHNLYHQFIDQDLSEILTQILEHFGYFLHFNASGQVSAKKIDLARAVDHVYTDEISSYTPDDSFSSFTNRVVVKGEGQYDIEVLYDMESVGTVTGTVLPFGGTKTHKVWYSEDHERTCRDPQLVVNTSIREYELFLLKGGGNEYISDTDSDEQWCEITMEAPDLTGVYIALAAAIVATGTAALSCTLNCGGFIFALSIETQLLGYAIGALAQYDYEIQARPIGFEKQTFQAEANDYELQRELNGHVLTQDIDDSFCYTVANCQDVADRELAIVKAQRKRVSFSKPAHLQDEIGDMIQINHPYTGQSVSVFVTALTRTWQKGSGVTDKIEGWRV